MKATRLTIMLGFLLALLPVRAQNPEGLSDSQRVIGHTVTDQIDVNGAAVGQAGTYSFGAHLTPAELENYCGCKIVGVRLAAACDLGRSRIFLYGSGASGLTEIHSQNQRIYEGWNNVFFNGDGFEISGEEGLFYGFDYTETAAMVAEDRGGLCGVGGGSTGGFELMQDGQLYDVTGVGDLCIQLIVDVTNLPAHNLGFTFVDGGFKYKASGEELEIFTMVQNAGRERAENFTVGARLGSDEPQYIDVNTSVAPGAQEVWQYIFPAPMGGSGIVGRRLELWIEKVNGEPMAENLKKVTTVDRWWYDESKERGKAYLEIYTDQDHPAGALLDEVIEGLSDEDFGRVIISRIVAPGNTLASEGAGLLHGLYAYTLPCFTVNRSFFPGEAHTAYDLNDYFGMLPPSFLSTIVSDIIYQDYLSPAFCTVDLESDYDRTSRELTVTVSGTVLEGLETAESRLGVTLMLTEDGVTGRQAYLDSNGRMRYDSNYTYTDLARGYMTAPEGTAVDTAYPDDGSHEGIFELTRSITLPEDWNPDRMNVTALMHVLKAPEARSVGDCDILACSRQPITGGSGVKGIGNGMEEGPTEYYDLQGRRLPSRPTKGLWIERHGTQIR